QKAKRDGSVRKDGVLIDQDGGRLKAVNFEISPIKNIPGGERYYLVVFEEASRPPAERSKKDKKEATDKKNGKKQVSQVDLENKSLKEELEATREYLQSIIEEQRTTNEELRSANEEIQSSNEELQSTNEELETAKEELQSTNEELTTVNEELYERNQELSRVNNDLSNLLSGVNLPILMLDRELRIRRFTPLAQRAFNVIPTDVGRSITEIRPNLILPDLEQILGDVVENLHTIEREVQHKDGSWYSLRVRPYQTSDNRIDGAVMVLVDI